jgi:hypothetical protein
MGSLSEVPELANFLKTLFIVSDVRLIEKTDDKIDSPAWSYSGSLNIPGASRPLLAFLDIDPFS